MKTIGLLGGMSWESTAGYYREINQGVKKALGGLHSAKIAMYSVDFEPIEQLQHAGDWQGTAVILSEAAKKVEAAGADFLLICTNTMHLVAPEIEKHISIPILHIADATAEVLIDNDVKTVGLLGTAFTMEQDFYKGRLSDKYGLNVIVPDEKNRKTVHDIIYQELCLGEIKGPSKAEYLRIIHSLTEEGAEAVILGCTEIGMLVNQDDTDVTLLDTTAIHAQKAVEQGYFLSCQQKPYEGMDVKSADANSLFIKAKVTSVESRMGHMFQIFIEPLDDFSFKPGQFLNVKNAAGTIRSYSIASTDQSKGALLEIHVRQHEHGEVSSWLCDTNRVGEEIEISGANGSCFYVSGRTEQPMLLIGTGTGLAPLLGIIRESLSHGHTGPIELYHGAVNNGGLYFTDELNKLADKHQNLKVFYGALEKGNEGDEVFEGLIQNHALTNNPDLKGWRVFLCGDPGMVMATKTKAYLADAMLSDIFSDPFDIKKVEF